MMTIRRTDERGHAEHAAGADRAFSFGNYHDPRWMGFRSLRVFNDDLVRPGMGFGMHPHRDMEIVTYSLRAFLEHRDSMGNGRVLTTGDVQYIAAGSGVRHSEFNPAPEEAAPWLQNRIVPDRKAVEPRSAGIRSIRRNKSSAFRRTKRQGIDGHQRSDSGGITKGRTAGVSRRANHHQMFCAIAIR